MTQTENTTELLKGKHLTYKERIQIEMLRSLDKPMSGNKIAEKLGRARQTIHTEIKDGTIRQIRKQRQNGKVYEYEYYIYSADVVQAAYDKARLNSVKQPKWICAPKFMAYADYQIKLEKQSPDVVVGRAKKFGLFPDEDIPSTTTLYNYIDQGFMETKNIDLHLKVHRKTCKQRSRKNKTLLGELIEKRPDVVESREEFGHWEIDTVAG